MVKIECNYAGPRPGVYPFSGGLNMELEPKQRNALLIGALIGAMLGAGTGWLLAQPVEGDIGEPRKPIRPGDVLKLVKTSVNLLRDLDDVRVRM
jgi:hypothetical protein